jgi:hypothetical protein
MGVSRLVCHMRASHWANKANVSVCLCAFMYACMYVKFSPPGVSPWICMCVYLSWQVQCLIHIYIYMYIHIYICMDCMCELFYTCMQTCMHVFCACMHASMRANMCARQAEDPGRGWTRRTSEGVPGNRRDIHAWMHAYMAWHAMACMTWHACMNAYMAWHAMVCRVRPIPIP